MPKKSSHSRRPLIVRSSLMRPFWTLNLFGVLISRDPAAVSERTVNHELIHTAQMRELLWLPFYIIYGIEWLFRLIATGSASKAYRSVSFEREAYDNDRDPGYLSRRRHFSQWRASKPR